MGANSDGKSWSIGVRDPDNKARTIAVLKLQNKAIATSGTYENYYIYNNEFYSHIIDPRTGYTVKTDLKSVTIIADDCVTADALATAVFVLGKNRSIELIEKISGIECFLISEKAGTAEVLMSSGMKRYLRGDET